MLRGPLTLILIVAFALAGTEIQRRLRSKGIRLPAIEGPVWILLGFLSGPRGMGFFPPDILEDLRPVVLLGLAWIGLVFGMQIDFQVIRRLEAWHRRLGLFFPLVIGIIAAAGLFLMGSSPLVALALASVCMLASPGSLDAMARSRKPRQRMILRFLRLIMAFSGIPAVIIFGVASVLYSPVSSMVGGPTSWISLLATVAGIGLVAGYALLIMSRGVSDQLSIITILTGITAMVAGAASILGISPLPAAALTGAVVINRCVFPHRILKATHVFERPLLIALLVLVGAAIKALSFSWTIFVAVFLLRGLSLLSGGWVVSILLRRRGLSTDEPWLGFGLFPQGGLALGLVVALLGTGGPVPGVLEAMALAMILNQLIGDLWYRRQLFETPEIL